LKFVFVHFGSFIPSVVPKNGSTSSGVPQQFATRGARWRASCCSSEKGSHRTKSDKHPPISAFHPATSDKHPTTSSLYPPKLDKRPTKVEEHPTKPDNDATSSVLYPTKAEEHPASSDGYLIRLGKRGMKKGSYLTPSDQEETKLGSYLIRLGKRGTKIGSYLNELGSYLFPSDKEETKKGKPQLALGRLGKEKRRLWNFVPRVSDENPKTRNQNGKTGNAIPGVSDENRETGNESSETGNEKGKTGILVSGLPFLIAGFPFLVAECRVAARGLLAAIGVLQFEREAHMKNSILNDLNDLEKPKDNKQLAHELTRLQMQQEHERELNDIRFKNLQREVDNLRESFERRVMAETEKVELRLRIELVEHLRLLHPLHFSPEAEK